MTSLNNGIVIIYKENNQQCDLCGKISYGPNGKCVCFQCGMKDESTAKKQFSNLCTNKKE